MKFCFWGDIAAALNGKTIGGGELQMALLTRSLAAEGHEVVVVDPFSDRSYITEEGIRILHVPDWKKGLPLLRILTHRIPAMKRLFIREQADFYYVRMRSFYNIASYRAARKVNGKFLLAIASDIDLLSLKEKYRQEYKANFRLGKYLTYWLPNDLAFNYLLKRADLVIRQHPGQQPGKRKLRGQVAEFANIIDRDNLPQNGHSRQDYFIYVGSLTMVKGADKLYNLVSGLDENQAVVVVGQPNDSRSVPIFDQLKKLESADVKGRYRHQDTLQLLAGARALINTSRNEGFPNVFLEAWALGVPVLSLKVNPGDIINKHELGICFDGDLEKMKDCVRAGKIPGTDKNKLIEYVRRFHDFKTAGKRFTTIILNSVKIFTLKLIAVGYENLLLG